MNQLALTFPGNKRIQESDIGAGFTFINKTPADIINTLIPIIFVLAGIILLGMLVAGGFTIFTSAGNPEKIKKGTGIITNAIIGLLVIFAAYWIIELLEITLGIQIFPSTPPSTPPSIPRPPTGPFPSPT
ncbi:MAG: hypothetical protein V1810_00745 [Candidatus Beckwithbacteria bacterium]